MDAAIREALAPYVPNGLIGLSCLAAGTDTVFAEAVLDLGGHLEVVLPSADYRERKVKPDNARRFDELVRRASRVRTMPYATANREAYEAANETLLGSIDRILAVWDGEAPADQGGTAAVVEQARVRRLPVEVIWPNGAERVA
ncbi:MAG TPA: hypothetical protein VGR21_04495 [Cryptosporangiaceae bacterium]|nr:hypothetical protein [Cryptosporangiaceae bacterium]